MQTFFKNLKLDELILIDLQKPHTPQTQKNKILKKNPWTICGCYYDLCANKLGK